MFSAIRHEIAPPGGARWHPYADLFPWIEGDALAAFNADVKARGVVEPIVFLDGTVLDGRNRYMAARAAGIEYPAVDYLGDDPLGFVLAKNLTRRHLNESQRAMVAGKLANLPPHRPARSAKPDDKSVNLRTSDAATLLNVSPRSVEAARKVQREAEPEIVKAVEQGHLPVSAAAQAAKLPEEAQREIAETATAGKANAVRTVIKKRARSARETALAAKQKALPDKKYGVIYADPEWRFEVWSRETGLDRSADNHYPTSDAGLISARDVASIAADDCALFLWSTAPMQPEAFKVMADWGFTYKSQFIWDKDAVGTGYWNRNKHEVLLVGTRGDIPAPAPGTQWDSVIHAPVGAHSAKPDTFAELIEAYFPNLPKIELNRRGPARSGWDAWGNEAGDDRERSIERSEFGAAGQTETLEAAE